MSKKSLFSKTRLKTKNAWRVSKGEDFVKEALYDSGVFTMKEGMAGGRIAPLHPIVVEVVGWTWE